AQPLDFLDLDKKSSFLNWKLASARKAFLDGHYLKFSNSFAEFFPELQPARGETAAYFAPPAPAVGAAGSVCDLWRQKPEKRFSGLSFGIYY
ncbi:MAG: hypothetical protein ACQET7_10270, partial [Thermodesulfobacteriota bacterium]